MNNPRFLSFVRQSSSNAVNRATTKPHLSKSISAPKPPSAPYRPRKIEPPDKRTKSETDGSSSTSTPSETSPRGFRRFFYDTKYRYIRRAILISPALFLAMLHSPYEILTVNGQSMAPFLNPNSSDGLPTTDRILVQRWHSSKESDGRKKGASKAESTTEFERGQIVMFPTPHRPEKIAVKRIVAIPGDVVQPLPGYNGGDSPVVVPWNHVWVEGDAGRRTESMDSNWYGPISQNLILGEVKAVLTSWFNWNWIDWKSHTWPARDKGRIEENAIMEAAVDPDAVNYSSGWRNGSISLILERMRNQPEQVLYTFVNDPKTRQETRRLYNNALYVAEIASSDQEKQLAKDLLEEMEDIYGREALVFGIRMRRKVRDRGELPNAGNSKIGEKVNADDAAASEAERWLKKQGWELARNADGTVRTNSSRPS